MIQWLRSKRKRLIGLKDDLMLPDQEDRLKQAQLQRAEAARKLQAIQRQAPAIVRHVGEQELLRRQNGIVALIENALQRGA